MLKYDNPTLGIHWPGGVPLDFTKARGGVDINEPFLVFYRKMLAPPYSVMSPGHYWQVNDYGFALVSPQPIEFGLRELGQLLAAPDVDHDILQGVNASELVRRQFREVARVANLVFQGYPGQGKTARQLQASAGLIYDVFAEYDPQNLLLEQTRREVLERQLEASRLHDALRRMRGARAVITRPPKPTPFGFPLIVEVFREKLSTEELAVRVARMVDALEAAAPKD